MLPTTPHKSLSGVITSEDALVEQPGLDLLMELGWTHADVFNEEPGPTNPTGRLSFRELMLPVRLRTALRKLNPTLPDEALKLAEIALAADRTTMLPMAANREVYKLMRDGIPVQVRQPDGSLKDERVAVIDWTRPEANDFFVASQVWIESSLYKRRPDAVGFVNGIPLLLIEWKDLTQPVQEPSQSESSRLPRTGNPGQGGRRIRPDRAAGNPGNPGGRDHKLRINCRRAQ